MTNIAVYGVAKKCSRSVDLSLECWPWGLIVMSFNALWVEAIKAWLFAVLWALIRVGMGYVPLLNVIGPGGLCMISIHVK